MIAQGMIILQTMPIGTNESIEHFLGFSALYFPRIAAAVVAGAIIGIENQVYGKPAGLRTNIVLCVACTLITVVSLELGRLYSDSATRITSQILTGIGFLGGGVILRHRDRITGITTASTIFANAAIGITIGGGFIYTGIAASLAVAIVLFALKPVDRWIEASPTVLRARKRGLTLEQHRKKRATKIKAQAVVDAEAEPREHAVPDLH